MGSFTDTTSNYTLDYYDEMKTLSDQIEADHATANSGLYHGEIWNEYADLMEECLSAPGHAAVIFDSSFGNHDMATLYSGATTGELSLRECYAYILGRARFREWSLFENTVYAPIRTGKTVAIDYYTFEYEQKFRRTLLMKRVFDRLNSIPDSATATLAASYVFGDGTNELANPVNGVAVTPTASATADQAVGAMKTFLDIGNAALFNTATSG